MNMWKPEESDRKYTRRELARNWLQYHIWYIVAIVAVAAMLGSWIYSAVSYQPPDYQVAYVGENILPTEAEEALTALLTSLGEDLNGDGKVDVLVKSYCFGSDPQMQAAASVGLTADLQLGESFLFFLEDPASFQAQYQILSFPDGEVPGEEDMSPAGKVYAWKDCPALADQDMDELAAFSLGRLYLGRRCAYEKDGDLLPGWEALWRSVTAGAVPLSE